MPAEIRIRLSQLSCLQRNGLNWPNRVLFVFAFRAGADRGVELAGPRWMVDGETIRLDPPQTLFRARSTALAIAIRGEDLGRDGRFDDNALSLELMASSIQSELDQSSAPGIGGPWEAGIRALESGIEKFLSPECGRQIFSFSRVYSTRKATRALTLSHTISDEEGEVASRYKLGLVVNIGEAALG